MAQIVWISLLAVFSLLIAASDFRVRRIKNNWLLLALLMQGLWLLAMAFGVLPRNPMIPSWAQALTGFGIGLLVFYPLWRFKAMGAADVKLIATLGFMVGVRGLLPTLLMASVAAGMHVLLIIWQGRWQTARMQWQQGSGQKRGLPYGAYLALSALAWVVWMALGGYG